MTDPAGLGAAVAARALVTLGHNVVGVALYGSWVRGEATLGRGV